ncbi:hypothetical protein DWB77_03320 [Streptomyces hundungensis]|uniref:Uncharacterized protein n=1 Tax=Streptomyces hundungensis TaxID=1077946 RepID=A0A387HK96_9ACTN|nr:hypothetical protein [Streptomyces hundungensis]AYG81178.1 hypothetical protein DWB77_03320 [Streptomyces hundungensis]
MTSSRRARALLPDNEESQMLHPTRRLTKATTASTALALAGALLLTGCGGGSKGDVSDKSAASPSASPSPAAPSATASAPAVAENRPKVTLPEGETLAFDPETTGDPVKDAVLRDNAEYVRAVDEAIAGQDAKAPKVAFYAKDDALVGAMQWIAAVTKQGVSITGTIRYLDRQVSIRQDGAATLMYCGDETKGFTKDRKTGKVNVTPANGDSYISYALVLRKNDKGVWQATKLSSVRGDKKCQR